MSRFATVVRSLGALVAVLLAVAVVVAVMLGPRVFASRATRDPGGQSAAASQPGSAPVARPHPTGFFRGWFVSPTVGWMVTPGRGTASLSRTVDGGAHWQQQLALPYPRLFQRDMSMINDKVAFAAVGAPVASVLRWRLFSTADGGKHWTAHELPDGGNISGLDFVSEDVGWALQTNADGVSTLFRTADGGSAWAPCTEPASGTVMSGVHRTDHLEGVRFANTSIGWIGGWETGAGSQARPLYYSTLDGCRTWQKVPLVRSRVGPGPEQPVFVDLPGDMAGSGAAGAATIRQLGAGTTSISVFTSRTGIRDWAEAQVEVARTRPPAWSIAGTGFLTIGDNVVTSRSVGTRSTPAGLDVLATQFVSSTVGFTESQAANGSTSLLRTADAGRHWSTVATW